MATKYIFTDIYLLWNITHMETFAVLAEPSRRDLLTLLREGEASVTSLVERTGLSQPVVSKHLRILREAGFVSVLPQGQRRMYRLAPEPIAEIDAWLEPFREFWADRLDALEQHLAAEGATPQEPGAARSAVQSSEGGSDGRSQSAS
jgi:DNA-binding transcriptional ArsR family regulator